MLWLLITLGIFLWWLVGYKYKSALRQIVKELPSNIPAWPIIGHSYLFLGSDEDRMKAFQRLGRGAIVQGGTMTMWQGRELYVYVADPDDAEIILKSCLAKDQNTNGFHRIVTGNGSIFAPVDIWRPRRKVLASVFSLKNVNGFVEIFATQSATMVELLRPMAGAGDFSIWKYITTYTFDSVSETNFGIKMNSQKENHHPFLEAFDKGSFYVAQRMVQPWLHSDFIYHLLPRGRKCQRLVDYVNNYVKEIIKEKRKTMAAYDKNVTNEIKPKPRTFLDMIIESSGRSRPFSDVELSEETKVILMAGNDTSAVGTCFTLLMLARHPEIQEAVYQELHEVFGNSHRKLVVEDLPHLKYLEAVIKESLRLYPPVPVISREVHNNVKLPTGTTLVDGVRAIVCIWSIHRNPRYWGEDADQFKPDRFLKGLLKHPAQYMPFSHGMRNCLGYQYAMLSMKTAIASLLRSYRVLPPVGLDPDHYQDPLRVKFCIMMKELDNFIVRLEERV